MVKYTECVVDNGAGILANGKIMTVEQVLQALNTYESQLKRVEAILKSLTTKPVVH